MNDAIELGIATDADLPALSDLLAQLFAQEHEFQPDSHLQRRGLREILANPELGEILIARDDQRAVAMVTLLYTVSTALGGRVAWLEDMVVAESYRGAGLGSRLLDHAINHARRKGCLRLTLLTDSDNSAAQSFYRKHGFQTSAMQAMRLFMPVEQDQQIE